MINVTQANIDQARMEIAQGGKRECCCPVALAMIDAGYTSPLVRGGLSGIRSNKVLRLRVVPDKVREFIMDFDMGKPVQPFSFEENAP